MDKYTNLLEETKKVLSDHDKKIDDIKWIGTKNVYVSIDDFLKKADTKYDDGFGAQEVACNLVIVGDNWWLTREEYDGAEGWRFNQIPTKPDTQLKLNALTVHQAEANGLDVSCGWETLEVLNEGEEICR